MPHSVSPLPGRAWSSTPDYAQRMLPPRATPIRIAHRVHLSASEEERRERRKPVSALQETLYGERSYSREDAKAREDSVPFASFCDNTIRVWQGFGASCGRL